MPLRKVRRGAFGVGVGGGGAARRRGCRHAFFFFLVFLFSRCRLRRCTQLGRGRLCPLHGTGTNQRDFPESRFTARKVKRAAGEVALISCQVL